MLATLLMVSMFCGMFFNAAWLWKQLPHDYFKSFHGNQFIPISRMITRQKSVGFISGFKGDAYQVDFYQAQYMLAPVVVEEGAGAQYTIVSGYDRSHLEQLLVKQNTDLIGEFDGPVYLIKSKNNLQ